MMHARTSNLRKKGGGAAVSIEAVRAVLAAIAGNRRAAAARSAAVARAWGLAG